MIRSLSALSFLCLCSCASVEFTSYEGSKQGPVSDGAFVDREYALPIYKGFPPKPYYVIGFIEASDRQMSIEGCDHAAVRAAKAKGADAVLLLGNGTQYGGTRSGSSFTANSAYSGQAQATAYPALNSAYGTASGTSTTSGFGSSWSQPIWLEQAQYVAIKWK